MLEQGKNYTDLANTKVEFGYLFMIGDHDIEALLKVITDKTTIYFAVHKSSVMMLSPDFNEQNFDFTTETFLDIHG